MRLFSRREAGRLGFAAKLVVSIFILVSAVMPFTHHSFDCHLKSLTHCRACTVAAGAKAPNAQSAPAAVPLNDAGAVIVPPSTTPELPSLSQSSDRGPPSGN